MLVKSSVDAVPRHGIDHLEQQSPCAAVILDRRHGDVDDPRIARRRERPQRQLPLGEHFTALACPLQQGLQRRMFDEQPDRVRSANTVCFSRLIVPPPDVLELPHRIA